MSLLSRLSEDGRFALGCVFGKGERGTPELSFTGHGWAAVRARRVHYKARAWVGARDWPKRSSRLMKKTTRGATRGLATPLASPDRPIIAGHKLVTLLEKDTRKREIKSPAPFRALTVLYSTSLAVFLSLTGCPCFPFSLTPISTPF